MSPTKTERSDRGYESYRIYRSSVANETYRNAVPALLNQRYDVAEYAGLSRDLLVYLSVCRAANGSADRTSQCFLCRQCEARVLIAGVCKLGWGSAADVRSTSASHFYQSLDLVGLALP